MCLVTEGKQKRGCPKITWQKRVEKKRKQMTKTWGGIQVMAKDPQMWKDYITALHAAWQME